MLIQEYKNKFPSVNDWSRKQCLMPYIDRDIGLRGNTDNASVAKPEEELLSPLS